MGFRPAENGFELKKGAFYNFCKKAEIDSDNDYFFIIDEINRADIGRVLGELMYALEESYRGVRNRIPTQYSNLKTYYVNKTDTEKSGYYGTDNVGEDVFADGFFIPENLHI
jgi:5-methylcytosine-specific restriction endonuclease McrBC GTP-binding regulatory subunit McrB